MFFTEIKDIQKNSILFSERRIIAQVHMKSNPTLFMIIIHASAVIVNETLFVIHSAAFVSF